MVLELKTTLNKDDANRRWYNQVTLQREIQNPRGNHISFDVYKKSQEEREELKLAVSNYKNAMKSYYGKDWKKSGYMNVPLSYILN